MIDEAVVRVFMDDFAQAWNRADAAATSSVYRDDGLLIDPFGNKARGPQELQQLFTDLWSGPLRDTQIYFTLETVRQLRPDLAFVDGVQHVSGIKASNGQELPEQAFHVSLLLTDDGGRIQTIDARVFAFAEQPV